MKPLRGVPLSPAVLGLLELVLETLRGPPGPLLLKEMERGLAPVEATEAVRLRAAASPSPCLELDESV